MYNSQIIEIEQFIYHQIDDINFINCRLINKIETPKVESVLLVYEFEIIESTLYDSNSDWENKRNLYESVLNFICKKIEIKYIRTDCLDKVFLLQSDNYDKLLIHLSGCY